MKTRIIFLFICLLRLPAIAQSQYPKIKVSEDIELTKLSEKAYAHTSVSEMKGFGMVSSNGLLLVDNGEAYLFDSPVTNKQTEVLTAWIADSLHVRITTFIPNHWHEDCMGGLDYLHSKGIKTYANQKTIDIAKENGLPQPQHGFKQTLKLKLHHTEVICYYPGAAHSTDNIVVWIPSEKILFPGCMVKDIHSKGLGNVADGNAKEWPKTLDKILKKFPDAKIVIPGHGQIGNIDIIKHTRELTRKP